jgi:hypothetical protein
MATGDGIDALLLVEKSEGVVWAGVAGVMSAVETMDIMVVVLVDKTTGGSD